MSLKNLNAIKIPKNLKLKLSNKKIKNEIINIGSNLEIKIIDVAKLIMKNLKVDNKKLRLFMAPKGSVLRRKPNVSKLKKLIGKLDFISLKKGIGLLLKKN